MANAVPYKFAIVGLGPRGHYALECLLSSLCKANVESGFEILGFEKSEALGHGPVYAVEQADSNWININERLLDLPSRAAISFGGLEVPAFVGYHEWAQLNFDCLPSDRIDSYPPRAKIGRYLEERFQSMAAPLIEAGILEILSHTADEISNIAGRWQITSEADTAHQVDDILLTVGHQPTMHDDQIRAWKNYSQASSDLALFENPYPVEQIIKLTRSKKSVRMAIRGYGLATIDVVRAVALEFGRFESTDPIAGTLRYIADEDADVIVTPFSLDGLPMGPKPISPAVDAQFAPSRDVLKSLSDRLNDRVAQKEARDASFLTSVMCQISASIYLDLGNRYVGEGADQTELEIIAQKWIEDQSYKHPILLDPCIAPQAALGRLITMATGEGAISFDYCIGQVWRHCQPIIYSALSHSALSDDLIAQIIFTDEGLKRYSYGPPVASLQQLVALSEAGVLNLEILSDPAICTNHGAWILTKDDTCFEADIMVDGVLDSPKIKSVTSNLLKTLLKNGLIDPVHDDLGIFTSEDAYIQTRSGRNDLPIALLGRLAKGTVIGVDAILECFGQRVKVWSDAAVCRAESKLIMPNQEADG